MSNIIYRYVNIYEIEAVCTSPLHVGSGEGEKGEILIHPVSDKPFIQATSIAGCFQEYARQTFSKEMCDYWFGSSNSTLSKQHNDCRSRLVFTDAFFNENEFKMELRSRVRIDKVTGTTMGKDLNGKTSGQLLQTEYISRGSKLHFTVYEYYTDETKDDCILLDCLHALDKNYILFGGQLSNGCGSVAITSVYKVSCDMYTDAGRKQWMKYSKEENHKCAENDILNIIRQYKDIPNENLDFFMDVTFDQTVLVKGNGVDKNRLENETKVNFDSDKNRIPDYMQLMDGRDRFVIPGSSIKGVFRNRMEMILSYVMPVGADRVKDLIFEDRSKMFFYDACLEDGKVLLKVRNHIDHFTGGVMNKQLFTDAVNTGNAQIHVHLSGGFNENWTQDTYEKAAALILLTMRDCAVGAVTIGSGYNVGRGFMTVHNISVKKNDNVLIQINEDDMKQNMVINDTVTKWLTSLQKEA